MKARKWYVIAAVLFVSVGLIACSDDDPDNPGVPPGGSSNPSAEPFTSPIPEGWSKVDWTDHYPDFTYKGLSPSCTHCPMDDCESQFYFFAKGGSVNNLVVYFEGGGACWHTMNCIYESTTNTGVRATVESLGDNDGIGDDDNPDNPFRDWSMVYIPYCTGDIHSGANDYDYPDDLGFHLLPDFNHWTIRHRGKVNFRVVLQWIQDTFTTAPDKIFVTGSSAGAYGALMNFPDIRDAYPSSTAYCFPDAGNGITPDSDAVFKDLAQRAVEFSASLAGRRIRRRGERFHGFHLRRNRRHDRKPLSRHHHGPLHVGLGSQPDLLLLGHAESELCEHIAVRGRLLGRREFHCRGVESEDVRDHGRCSRRTARKATSGTTSVRDATTRFWATRSSTPRTRTGTPWRSGSPRWWRPA